MTRLVLLVCVLAVAFPATADARTCNTKTDYEALTTVGVKCKKAKKVLRAFWRNGTERFGFDCEQEQYPGGVTTTCTKGELKRIEHQSAD